ncbi:MAG TPA: heparinase II/III family protein [Bryobacteraceae bacterium]|nr:heparinase II/III family protein [Bryobacteraceae bacterium]
MAAGDTANYLLVTQSEIDAAKDKAARLPWAREAMSQLLRDAETALTAKVDVPSRGGQWGHWYVCKKDGVTLEPESPVRHRCPYCGTVYTGYPYDDVYLTRIHSANATAMRNMGLAFRITGRQEFAAKVRELLLGYSKQYGKYPHRDNLGNDSVNAGRVLSTTLDESTWTIPVAWGYSLIRDTLSDADRTHVVNELLYPLTDTIIGRSYARLPNIQCWKDSAIACVGFALGDKDLVAEALDHPVRGFHALMSRYVLPGGLWYEGSLGYQHYAMTALSTLAEAARHNGIDLYADDRYRSMFEAPLALAMQDGSTPGFNDNPGPAIAGFADLYEIGFARWHDPRYGRVAREGKRTTVTALLYGAPELPASNLPLIPSESILLKEAGYAVLRSPEVTAAVRFGLHGLGHGHPDKLNVVTSGFGATFGLDPGSINYGAPLHGEWYRSTIAHNTVCVDGQLQGNADGELVEWKAGAGGTKLKAAAMRVYDGVALTRSLELRGPEIADTFECASGSEHQYDWAFHARGTLTTSLGTQLSEEGIPEKQNGYQHIHGVHRAKTDESWWVRWEHDGCSLTLRVQGAPGTTVFTGEGPGRTADEKVAVVIVRRRAQATQFAVRHIYAKAGATGSQSAG